MNENLAKNQSIEKNSNDFTNFRLYGGPSFTKFFDKDIYSGDDISTNFAGGGELHIKAGKKSYYIVGLGYSNLTAMKEKFDSKVAISMKLKYQFLEIPIGIGFYLGKKQSKGIFMNFTLVNRYTLSTDVLSVNKAENYKLLNEVDFYNIGLKYELGYKFKLFNDIYASLSLAAKPMFLKDVSDKRKNLILDVSPVLSVNF